MKSRPHKAALLLLLACACTAESTSTPEESNEWPAGIDGRASCELTQPFVLQEYGGGRTAPGQNVYSEPGWRYLAVDTQCRFAVYGGSEKGTAKVGMLGTPEAVALQEWLDKYDWSTDGQTYFSGYVADAPAWRLRFGEMTINILPNGGTPMAPDEVRPETLRDLFASYFDAAQPIEQTARFTVFGPARPPDMFFHGEVQWPLATNLAELASATLTAESGEPLPVHQVVGSDAAKLHALRAALLADEIGYGQSFIPVLDKEGVRYVLHVRSTTPFEDEEGQIDPSRLE